MYFFIKSICFLIIVLWNTFLYAIVPQVGYVYFPELSMAMDAYFGKSIIKPFQIFFLSNLIVVPLALYLSTKFKFSSGFSFRFSGFPGKSLFWVVYIFYFCSMWMIFILNIQYINYETASASGGETFFIYVFPIMNKLGIGLAVLSYAYRNLGYFYRCLSFFVIATIIFFSFRLGARVDVISLFIGIIILNIGNRRLFFRDYVKVIFIIPIGFFLLLLIEANRNDEHIAMSLSIQDIIAKDYLGPGHTVFGLIYYEYVNPFGQLISNIVNSFPANKNFIRRFSNAQ